MDNILLVDSDADIVEKMFEEVKEYLTCWRLQIAPGKDRKRRF